MDKDLFAILDALAYNVDEDNNVEADPERQDVDKARKLATAYVKAHPDDFRDYQAFGPDKEGLKATVNAVETFRTIYHQTGMESMRNEWARAEAWHFHSWEPQEIGGEVQVQVRNLLQGGSK